VDETIGTAVMCECTCPPDSTNPNCADPNTTPIAKTYAFTTDSAGTAVLTITDSVGVFTYLIPSVPNP
jgi:hypothetical protein